MKIKVIINGANGKMGQEAVKAVEAANDLTLVAALGRQDNLAKAIADTQASVVVDLTEPAAVYDNTKTILENGAHPVVGTTGLTDDQLTELQQLAKQQSLGGIIVPNFSIGAVLMMRFASEAAKFYQNAEILEYHHPRKKDSPSGTARRTQEMMGQACPIHSIRLPGVVAEQQVLFGGEAETLMIQHRTIDRAAFMPGLLLCCRKISSLNELAVGLEALL